MKSVILLAIYLLCAGQAWAISETNFDVDYTLKVDPFYNAGHTDEKSAFFLGVNRPDGSPVRIRYGEFIAKSEKAAIVIVPGRGEPFIKYRELIYDLGSRGYSIYILDHRGQGYSDRLISDPEVGYVDNFNNYPRDLNTFIQTVVKKTQHQKIYMLAHSMGGAIAAKYLFKFPGNIDAAVLSAPMFEMNLGTHSIYGAFSLIGLMAARGKLATYAPGIGPYNWFQMYEGNQFTSSRKRFSKSLDFGLKPDEMKKVVLGGASYQWVNESLLAQINIELMTPTITTPILIFQAGLDYLVQPSGENLFRKHCQHCELIRFPKARHEILQEVDSIRDEAIDYIISFFN
jgi:lysophospholipase